MTHPPIHPHTEAGTHALTLTHAKSYSDSHSTWHTNAIAQALTHAHTPTHTWTRTQSHSPRSGVRERETRLKSSTSVADELKTRTKSMILPNEKDGDREYVFLELASFEWKENRSLEIHPPWPRFAGLGSNPGSPIRVKRKAVLVSTDLRNNWTEKQSTCLCSPFGL